MKLHLDDDDDECADLPMSLVEEFADLSLEDANLEILRAKAIPRSRRTKRQSMIADSHMQLMAIKRVRQPDTVQFSVKVASDVDILKYKPWVALQQVPA